VRLEKAWTGRAGGRVAAIVGAGLIAAALGAAPAQAAERAGAAGLTAPTSGADPCPKFPISPQFCGYAANNSGQPLSITGSSLQHGNWWLNAAGDTQDGPVIINNYDGPHPTNSTSIPNGARGAYWAMSNGFVDLVGSMSLGNAKVNTNTHFKVAVFSRSHHDWGCDVTSPNPANGWVCVTAVWSSGYDNLQIASNTYCCASDHLATNTTPTVMASAASVVTLPVKCEASRRGTCRGILSFRAGKSTGTTRFAIPRGSRRQVAVRLRKPLRRSSGEYRVRLSTIQPNGRAIRSHEQGGRSRHLLAPAR
jgi:hypothetical protein